MVAQQKRIRLGTMRFQVPSLASLSGLRIHVAVTCGVGRRHSWDLALLWLWCRPTAAAPIRLLAWEPPYATGGALKREKEKKKVQKGGKAFPCGFFPLLKLPPLSDGGCLQVSNGWVRSCFVTKSCHAHWPTPIRVIVHVSGISWRLPGPLCRPWPDMFTSLLGG